MPSLPHHCSGPVGSHTLAPLTALSGDGVGEASSGPRAKKQVHLAPAYLVPEDVVVCLPCAVDADDAKDYEDHGACVHQRPNSRLPAAHVHAGVEAEGGREVSPGYCQGSQSWALRGSPHSTQPPWPLHPTFLTGHVEEAFRGPIWAGAEQAARGRHAHSPMERWLVRLCEIQLPAGKEGGLSQGVGCVDEAGRPLSTHSTVLGLSSCRLRTAGLKLSFRAQDLTEPKPTPTCQVHLGIPAQSLFVTAPLGPSLNSPRASRVYVKIGFPQAI